MKTRNNVESLWHIVEQSSFEERKYVFCSIHGVIESQNRGENSTKGTNF